MTAVVASGSPGSSRQRSSLRTYARAAAFATTAAFVLTVALSAGSDTVSGRLGGDYPAFWAAGALAGAGAWDDLYDPDVQAEAQASLFAGEDGGFLYFAYPPHVAMSYRPLAALDYRVGYVVHTAVMVAMTVAALALLRPVSRVVDANFELLVTTAALFHPLLRAVTGGQNTAFTLLLFALLWRSLHDGREVLAGLAVGALTYKPQYAVPLFGLLVLRGRPRPVLAATMTAAAAWAMGAAVMGVDWLPGWWREVSDFAGRDAAVNAHNAVSWLGFSEAIFGAVATTARLIAAPLVLATLVALVWAWRSTRLPLDLRMGVTVVGVILASPHTMYYDAGLLIIPAIVALERADERTARVLAICWLAAWAQLAASSLGVAPMFALVLAATALMGTLVHTQRAPRVRALALD